MAGIAPVTEVAGPSFTPLPFGLFSVLTFRDGAPERWFNGVSWKGDECGTTLNSIRLDCDSSATTGLPKVLDVIETENGLALPFTVYAHYRCSPIGNTLAYAQQQAEKRLLRHEEAAVTAAVLAFIADNAESQGAGVTWGDALGKLEQHLATEYGGLGVLYANRLTVARAEGKLRLNKQGSTLVTETGTPVVVHSGGNPEQLLISAPLFGYRSEIFVPSGREGDLLDRQNNDLYAVAERTYVVGIDKCGLATASVPATA